MTQEEALKAFEEMYGEMDKENWLFIGTINPQMVEHAIKALSIIRCKDCCRYWQEYGVCTKLTNDDNMRRVHVHQDDYCSFAERKEE